MSAQGGLKAREEVRDTLQALGLDYWVCDCYGFFMNCLLKGPRGKACSPSHREVNTSRRLSPNHLMDP